MIEKKLQNKKNNILSDIILLNQAIDSNFYFPFFLKKVYKSKKTTWLNILSKFSSKKIEIFWKKTKQIKWINNYHLFSDCFFFKPENKKLKQINVTNRIIEKKL